MTEKASKPIEGARCDKKTIAHSLTASGSWGQGDRGAVLGLAVTEEAIAPAP